MSSIEGVKAPPILVERVAVPRTVDVYPNDSDEARRMIDVLRDEKRQWMLTAKILYDDYVKLASLYEAEKRKHVKKG